MAHPGREFLAIDLEAADPLAAPSLARVPRGSERELTVRPDLGDAGVLLDATAKAAYQTRIKELRAELDEADFGNDLARAANARAQLDFLVAELARAVGLGGRDRRAASHAERARLNVTRAIRAAMVNLARGNPPWDGIWMRRSGLAATAPTPLIRARRSAVIANQAHRRPS